MLCLGVETSCDETAVALVRDGRLVKEIISSQVDMHAVFGGVVPELASREHLRVLCPLLDRLLQDAGVDAEQIQGIAVARGPGLLGSLLVGLGLAKGLACSTGARLVGVNHLQAHLLAAGLERELRFPAMGLLVSGGHTQITLMHSPLRMEPLGRTLDDAAGEAFDKAAKLLNLPYPGGVLIDRLGMGVEPDKRMFPRPYLDNQNLDFSFSGLKTAVATYVAGHPSLRFETIPGEQDLLEPGLRFPELAKVCASFAWSVADTLRIKLERAIAFHPEVEAIIIAGGVAANSTIREMAREVAAEHDLELILPSPALCTDNAAMVAYAGELLLESGLEHGMDLDAVPRGKPIPDDYRRASEVGFHRSGRRRHSRGLCFPLVDMQDAEK
jgi:N6-L-threonylcarbamoyladenine synthase